MKRVFLSVGLVGTIMATGLLSGAWLIDSAWAKGASRYASLDTLAQALHHIEQHFVEDTTTQDLVYGGIKGMTDSLDTHSTFLTPSDMKKAEARTEGWYTGVGIEVIQAEDGVGIRRVIPDSPADLAGIHRSDLITAIDDTQAIGLSAQEASALLKGAEDTQVTVTLRDTKKQTRTVSLSRVRVRDKAVRVHPEKPGFPRIEIAHFQRNTAADLETALTGLARRKGKVRGLILDLRDNPGGLLDEAVAVADIFLKRGLIYETRGQDNAVLSRADAKPGSRWEDTPLTVLVNKKSASASEIVAGALQAHERAKVVGEPTYGKGSVQRLYIFEDGSALKLTVSRYFLANDQVVSDANGIEPDVLVRAPTKKSVAADRLSTLVATLPEAQEAQALIETLRVSSDPRVTTTTDPQVEAAWKTVRATP